MRFERQVPEDFPSGRPLPPLKPPSDDSPVKTRASWRWMLGTFLTGIVGAALIGGALFAAFEGQASLAFRPRTLEALEDGFAFSATPGRAARKGDRMSAGGQEVSMKRVILESSVSRVQSKEFINVKPYVHLVASLALTTTEATADLPPFNPLKLFSEAAEDSAQSPKTAQIQSSGTIKVAQAAFSTDASFGDGTDPGMAEAELEVREQAEYLGSLTGDGLRLETTIEGSGDGLLAGTEDGEIEVTHNEIGEPLPREQAITEIVKDPGRRYFAKNADKIVTIAAGDTLSSVLMDNGASAQDAKVAAEAMEPTFSARQLKVGQEIRLSFAKGGAKDNSGPVRLSVYDEGQHVVTVGLLASAEGQQYVRLSEDESLTASSALHVTRYQSRARLFKSLYETGFRNGLADTIMSRMVRIHSYDVDFKRHVQSGDSIEIFYVADDNDGNVSGDPEILYSALTIRGETKKFYRFRTPDDGVVDFYDEEGKSAKKFLIRKPMNGGVLRSGFGMRQHPILRYRKMHTGVDWAAPSGTPIVAAGNGTIEKAEWKRGYGRYTVIRHANGYTTAYAHQSAFARGIVPGARVKQGQVIGYVGSTGLSTGPHLHYEVIVNARFVDPMRIRVPRGRTLQGRTLAAFQREKQRITRLMQQAPASVRVAQADTAATSR